MMRSIRTSLLTATSLLATPLALAAHEGHAGDHGWLAGALQPLLSLDHFLAGAFVAIALTLAVVRIARAKRAYDKF